MHTQQKRMALESKLDADGRRGEERSLALEAKLRDSELQVEVLRRDKKLMLADLEACRAKEEKLNDLYKDKLTQLESRYHSQLLQLQESKDRDFLEKARGMQDKIRALEEEGVEAKSRLTAERSRWANERQKLVDGAEEIEVRVRREEEHKRAETVKQVESLYNQRNGLQNEVSALTLKCTQLTRDLEAGAAKAQQERMALNEHISDMRVKLKEMTSYEQRFKELEPEHRKTRDRLDAVTGEMDRLKCALSHKDEAIARIKEELRRRDEEMDEAEQENAVKVGIHCSLAM